MQTLRFKTSLKCNGCVKAITPGMDSIKEIDSWRVFLDIQEKVLEVEIENSNEEEVTKNVIETVSKAGYTIERMK